jgi:hypothetical protein
MTTFAESGTPSDPPIQFLRSDSSEAGFDTTFECARRSCKPATNRSLTERTT